MKEGYSSKQKKIYEEYSLYSTDMLNSMVKEKKKHKSEVIRIINDILRERNNRGFYTPEPYIPEAAFTPEEDETPETDEAVPENAGEFPEPEPGSNEVYEEVPWLSKNQVYFPGISGAAGNYINVTGEGTGEEPVEEAGNEEGDEAEEDINIEEAQKNYWKCPKCNELVEMQFDVCWNCQSEIPKDVDHPGEEEIIKEIREKSGPVKTGGLGMAAIILGGFILLFDRDENAVYDDYIRYVLCGFFVLIGLFLIVVNFRKKE
jgi:hypothetical protein